MVKEILDGGAAPEAESQQRDAPRWSRAVSARLAGGLPERVRSASRRGWPAGTRKRIAVGLAAVLMISGGFALRDGVSNLASPLPQQSGALPESAAASWVAPVLAPGAEFGLTVEAGRRLVRIEHGTRRTQQTPLRGAPSLGTGGWATVDETVVIGPGRAGEGTMATVLDGTGRILRRLGPGTRILAGPHGWTAWVVRAAGTGGSTLQAYALDGTVRGPAAAIPQGTEPVAVLRDAVVLSTPSGVLSLWRSGGREPEQLKASGRIVSAAQGLLVVAQNCRQTCRFTLVNIDSGRITRLRTPARMRPSGEPILSRDGLWIATMVEPDTRDNKAEAALALAMVFDGGGTPTVVPGTRYRVASGSVPVAPAWSLGGQVFGYAPGGAGLYGYQPGETGARRLDVPGLGLVTRIVAG